MKSKILVFLKTIHKKLFHINDSPQRVALGFGLGIFLGVLPGTGPIAAITLALILKVNKASALIGSLLVNTWINVVTFIFAIKLGSSILGIDWMSTYQQSYEIIRNFHFKILFNQLALKILLPTLLGYFIISFILGIIGYFFVLIIIKLASKNNVRHNSS